MQMVDMNVRREAPFFTYIQAVEFYAADAALEEDHKSSKGFGKNINENVQKGSSV